MSAERRWKVEFLLKCGTASNLSDEERWALRTDRFDGDPDRLMPRTISSPARLRWRQPHGARCPPNWLCDCRLAVEVLLLKDVLALRTTVSDPKVRYAPNGLATWLTR